MKKTVIMLCAFLLGIANTHAANLPQQTEGDDITLSVGYNDTKKGNLHPRTQMRRPVINVSSDLITVPESLIGYEMRIVSDGEVIFSTTVTTTEIFLPTPLTEGYYQIQFVGEAYTFYGEFELS
ncbi:MAG: hypothetical protein HUK08_09040 [Bacteroidaceae bacterium]|nr:hypothetical protein [Bacteroidaceae bacterium]